MSRGAPFRILAVFGLFALAVLAGAANPTKRSSPVSAAAAPSVTPGKASIDVTDYIAIQNLIYTYADLIDRADWEGVRKLLGRPPSEAPFYVYPDNGTNTPRTQHVTTNVMITFDDPDHASAQSYFTVVQATASLPLQPIIAGRYHDKFARVNGVWRFTERRVEPRLWGNLTQHLKVAPSPGEALPTPTPMTRSREDP